jgi:hypothetical protein
MCDREDDFKFKIEIIREDSKYKDDFHIKGTELETLGAIEKVIILLNKVKNKIIKSVNMRDVNNGL